MKASAHGGFVPFRFMKVSTQKLRPVMVNYKIIEKSLLLQFCLEFFREIRFLSSPIDLDVDLYAQQSDHSILYSQCIFFTYMQKLIDRYADSQAHLRFQNVLMQTWACADSNYIDVCFSRGSSQLLILGLHISKRFVCVCI